MTQLVRVVNVPMHCILLIEDYMVFQILLLLCFDCIRIPVVVVVVVLDTAHIDSMLPVVGLGHRILIPHHNLVVVASSVNRLHRLHHNLVVAGSVKRFHILLLVVLNHILVVASSVNRIHILLLVVLNHILVVAGLVNRLHILCHTFVVADSVNRLHILQNHILVLASSVKQHRFHILLWTNHHPLDIGNGHSMHLLAGASPQ